MKQETTQKNPRGAGRPNPYGEPTEQMKFMVPGSKKAELKAIVKKQLKKWHMKKIIIAISVLLGMASCTTVKPVIKGDSLHVGQSVYKIEKSPAGRSYVIQDGKRVNLFRYEPKVTPSTATAKN